MAEAFTERKKLDIMRSELDIEQASFKSHWKDIAEYTLPRRAQFSITDTNKGDRRNLKIVDSTATMALRTLASGMMSGVTSPARPWFRLTTPDPELSELGSVKEWLHIVTNRMTTAFLRSNLYNSLPNLYGDLGNFATAPMIVEEDFDNVLRTFVFPVGSYWIANDEKLKVNVFGREFRLTVHQLLKKFAGDDPKNIDWKKFSTTVKNHYDRGNYQTWIDVCHFIYPNEKFDGNGLLAKHKKFKSTYYEKNVSQGEEQYLRESGYDYFPVLCPRWQTTGEDVYGTDCPGMQALGDIKALQIMQKRRLQAVEKHVNPPMVAPTSLKNSKTTILPGDITYSDEREGQKGFRPAHEVSDNLRTVMEAIAEHQFRIRRTFFEDLFLMLVNTDRREITAREIEERHEEKLLALGPVLEQLNQDLLDPLIDITFNIMNEQGWIPPAPEDLQGQTLKVEYISILAQAQKATGLAGIERFTAFAGQVATFDPQVLDKIDRDQLIDEYADITGVSPRIIRDDETAQKIREGRAEVARQQQLAANLAQAGKTAKDLAGAKTDESNALTELVGRANAGRVV